MLEQKPGPIFSYSNKDMGEEARLNVVSVDDAHRILNVLAAGGLIGKCVMSGKKLLVCEVKQLEKALYCSRSWLIFIHQKLNAVMRP